MIKNLIRLSVPVCVLALAGSISGQTGNGNQTGDASPASPVQPAPAWKMVDVDCKQASLRGLHVLDAQHIFASGSQGIVVHSIDGGANWNVQSVAGAEELDFRDIHAIDANNVLIISSGTPARIYRSRDGCQTWAKVCERTEPRFFFDAIDFWDKQTGVVMGDPIEGKLCLMKTIDGGKTWKQLETSPRTNLGEAGFAASGTNTITVGQNRLLVALGGAIESSAVENTSPTSSRILMSEDRGATWKSAEMPIKRTPSAGIFSLCVGDGGKLVAVGGDYKKPDAINDTFARSIDGGKTWSQSDSANGLTGFRSCVAITSGGHLVAVGPNGTDYSVDFGANWKRRSDEGFHAIDFTADGKTGWATGTLGRIGKWSGCESEGTRPVTGNVTLDGEPLAKVMITFYPVEGGRTNSIAETNDLGGYALHYTSKAKGAKPGKYKVLISKSKMMPNGEEKELLPLRYNRKSELIAEVTSGGDNVFDYVLTSEK